MARTKKKETRRGSPEAIAKRRAARSLNYLFDKSAVLEAMDGRTLKRKKRLLAELQQGKGGEPLKAHQVLSHATELFTMGENLTTLRALKPTLPPTPSLEGEIVESIRATQESYQFDPKAWTLLGIDIDAVMAGEDTAPKRTRRGRRKKAAD